MSCKCIQIQQDSLEEDIGISPPLIELETAEKVDTSELKQKAICEYQIIIQKLECGIQPDLEFLLEEISLIEILDNHNLFTKNLVSEYMIDSKLNSSCCSKIGTKEEFKELELLDGDPNNNSPTLLGTVLDVVNYTKDFKILDRPTINDLSDKYLKFYGE